MRRGVVTNPAPITLEQLFRYYKGLPHQAAAIQQLEQDLATNGYTAAMRRDRPWFETWSQDGKQQDLGPALKLIQEFEGCHLDAYLCPAGVATIGWGNTRNVKLGDKISRVEADMMLRQEVDRIAVKLAQDVPHWREMSDNQRSALVSFAYNLGAGFYGTVGFETITARLRDKDWRRVPEAMMLYRNPGSNFEAGLRRRREAEGRLWLQGLVLPQQQSAPRFTPSSTFTTRVTPHITYGELCLGEERRRFINQSQCDIATELCTFIEKARAQFGNKPVVITSGPRPEKVNQEVGGAKNSEHLYKPGCGAVDWYISGVAVKTVQDWCVKNWPYSTGLGAPKGFIHTGIRAGRPRVVWDY
jgi:lysozyme